MYYLSLKKMILDQCIMCGKNLEQSENHKTFWFTNCSHDFCYSITRKRYEWYSEGECPLFCFLYDEEKEALFIDISYLDGSPSKNYFYSIPLKEFKRGKMDKILGLMSTFA